MISQLVFALLFLYDRCRSIHLSIYYPCMRSVRACVRSFLANNGRSNKCIVCPTLFSNARIATINGDENERRLVEMATVGSTATSDSPVFARNGN